MSLRDTLLRQAAEQLRKALDSAERASTDRSTPSGGVHYAFGYLAQSVRHTLEQLDNLTARPTRRRGRAA